MKNDLTAWSVLALHAEDVPAPVDRQADLSLQLQLVLQEVTHLLWVEQVTEDPDLCSLPLDVGVARGQLGGLNKAAHRPPRLQTSETQLRNTTGLKNIFTSVAGVITKIKDQFRFRQKHWDDTSRTTGASWGTSCLIQLV